MVKQKIIIAEKLQTGTSMKLLCREYGISQDVIHRIRREYKLLSNFGNRGEQYILQYKKKIEWGYWKSFIYVVLTATTENPLTDLLLQEKAMKICGQHESTSFAANWG